jgi:hypothetical protein
VAEILSKGTREMGRLKLVSTLAMNPTAAYENYDNIERALLLRKEYLAITAANAYRNQFQTCCL